jgi:hypothetical protein
MAARAKNIPDLTERQGSIRRWYEEKTMRMLHLAPSGSSMLEILGEWPALYPPWTRPFGDYDADTFGPLLAVSDDGAAAPTISRAAYGSAKARALAHGDAMSLGIVIDGERITSAGEAPIGPDEYHALLSAAFGRTLASTNVGVRVNTRLYRLFPEFQLPDATAESAWDEQIAAAFRPFIDTPDRQPRPLTARIEVKPDTPLEEMKNLCARLQAIRNKYGFASVHCFTLVLKFARVIGTDDIKVIEALIDKARQAGFSEIAVDGEPRFGARERLMLASLLNLIEPDALGPLLDYARERDIRLTYHYQTDVDSAARTIWTGLQSARSFGFTFGKYGLMPLTLEEQQRVVTLVSGWTRGWTAIPAFYVDTPLVTAEQIFLESRCVEAACLWMRTVAAAGATMVLIDSPDRVTPRHLVRDPQNAGDAGVLTIDQIVAIDREASKVGLKALWSGSITARQGFTLAANRVHGIFSTSATAKPVAVKAEMADDPRLAVEHQPTEDGVRRVHAAVQCGFLSAALGSEDPALAGEVKKAGLQLLDAIDAGQKLSESLGAADDALIRGWRAHWRGRAAKAKTGFAGPPDAVRVWRGRKHKDLRQGEFFEKLGEIFIPFTVEMQRLYGLAAYLPMVLPPDHPPALPDEVALVFYKTKESYNDSKKYPGGRAYSDLHALVFDLDSSGSGFPDLLEANFTLNQPWHLFSNAADWQTGSADLLVALRKNNVSIEAYGSEIAQVCKTVQSSRGLVDGAVVFASEDWLVYWQHSPAAAAPMPSFANVSEIISSKAARATDLVASLDVPWDGFNIVGGEFFNMQFSVR